MGVPELYWFVLYDAVVDFELVDLGGRPGGVEGLGTHLSRVLTTAEPNLHNGGKIDGEVRTHVSCTHIEMGS